jgi:hypothetical protein
VPKKHVKLVEEEVYAVLGDVGEGDPKRWIYDIGASNQMIGLREVFTNLNTDVIGTVWFGDGYVVQIEGCDTILFACKNREYQTLFNAYYIPCLTTNIVSYGQLSESGFQIHIEGGFIRIHDEQM